MGRKKIQIDYNRYSKINFFTELLDVEESNFQFANKAVVFAHGFGSNKNENYNLIGDIANALKRDFAIIKFDFSGYGKSQGKQEDVCLSKMKLDLKVILDKATLNYREVNIIAHSMGAFVTSLLMPDNVNKIIFTSPPNPNIDSLIKNMQSRILNAGGSIDESGLSIYPRTSGEVQNLGSNFWKDLRDFEPVKQFEQLSQKTKLAIFLPKDDEVKAKDASMNLYSPFVMGSRFVKELNGNHNFEKWGDRKVLINEIQKFLIN